MYSLSLLRSQVKTLTVRPHIVLKWKLCDISSLKLLFAWSYFYYNIIPCVLNLILMLCRILGIKTMCLTFDPQIELDYNFPYYCTLIFLVAEWVS